MATLNVQTDYGAAGDGSTDDTSAIQSAVDDASSGDTVLLPATSAYYRVTRSGSGPAVKLNNVADNITIEGEGSNSEIRVDRTSNSGVPFCMGTYGDSNPSWTSITVRKLVFDGNRSNNGESWAFKWASDTKVTGKDVLMEDCIFQNAVRSGLSTNGDQGFGRMTFRYCTGRGNGTHGFDPVGTGEGSASDPEIKFYDCKAVNNDGISIDFHNGNHHCERFYTSGNRYGTKMGAAGGAIDHVTLKDCNIRDSGNNGFYQTFSDDVGYTMRIDNCQFIGHYDTGIRLQKQGNITIQNQMLIGSSGGEDSTDFNLYIGDGASIDASNATVYTQNCVNGPGVKNQSSGSSVFGTLYHYGNSGGAVDDNSGTLSVNSFVNEETTELNVPGASDTGAFTGDTSSGDDSGGDSTDSSDAPIFDDWTPRWDSDTSAWSINGTSSNTEDAILELDAGFSGRHALSCDAVGTATDVDLLGLVRVPSDDDSDSSWCRLIGRGSGTAGSETGYFVAFRDVPTFDMVKYVDGSATGLASKTIDAPPGTWLYVRFNITGNELKARYWSYGDDEPTSWDLTATDGDITGSGWVGAGGWASDRQQWDMFSVGTGGDAAQFVGADSSPSVTWDSPTGGATLSGSVTVQIGASDPEDSDDSLATEYRVDGGTWRTASYNSTSGYYEDSWDTTTVSDGEHSLEARVTDSAGNVSTSTVTVATDNSGTAPTVDSLSLAEVETSNADAEFDLDWQVSDADGDLSAVSLALVQDSDGSTVDSTTLDVAGDTATGTTRLVAADADGSGNSYTAAVSVADSEGNSASDTASSTETEDAGEAPSIYRFNVSEAGRPDPHAEVSVMWDVYDGDADLASVSIEVADSGGTVQSVDWTLTGSRASDTDSFRIKNGDGQSFDVTITVTDEAGQSTSMSASVTA